MNVQVAVREAGRQAVAQAIADCDIHPYPKSPKELYPFLERRWQLDPAARGRLGWELAERRDADPTG